MSKQYIEVTYRDIAKMMSSALPVEGEDKLEETGDPIWIGFLRRESSILLRRAFRFWLKMRFRKR